MATPPIGPAIRRARERKHWTQQQLADAVGVSLRSVGNWELGHHVPKNRIGALEDVLGVSLAGETPGPGPLADLEPWQDEWEAEVAASADIELAKRRDFILRSRASREAYDRYRSERRARREAQATDQAS